MSNTATFVGEGFKPFPNTIADRQVVSECLEWSDERIEAKVVEYWAFLDRTDLMPRARIAANQILGLLGFEMDERYKDDAWIQKLEDEVCHE